MIRDLVVAVKGAAAEILHHLLLTKRRGKSPIRLRKVKLVSLGSLEGGRRRSDAAPLRHGVVFFAHSRVRCLSILLACARRVTALSFRSKSRVKGSASCCRVLFLGVRLLNVEGGKKFQLTRELAFGLWRVKQRHLLFGMSLGVHWLKRGRRQEANVITLHLYLGGWTNTPEGHLLCKYAFNGDAYRGPS